MHTTNYYDTFIEVAEDCPVSSAERPPVKGDKQTVASLQFDTITNHPYSYTSDDVIFGTHATRNNISDEERDAAREIFFSKGQPCLRSSSLTKRYGWGVHSDAEGRVALFAVESDEYRQLTENDHVKHLKAMRSKRK